MNVERPQAAEAKHIHRQRPADAVAVEHTDQIVDINGVDDLIRVLDRDRIGRTLAMEVLRLGRLRAFDIHPLERKPMARLPAP